ncbi:hypothetical protein Q7P37_008740 [Cladosporium fusiforme]
MPSEKSNTTGDSKLQSLYNFFGFSEGYNFYLWITFAGALFAFSLARLMYFDITGIFCGPGSGMNHAAPGECYHYLNFDRYAIGIRLHLYTIIPAGLLVVLQFTPKLRHKFMIFHRVNGYLVILLALVANAGALMIARHAFGGTIATQALVGTLSIVTTGGLALAYYNIKRLQIDQHRAWMLRTWFYFTSIITLRIIMIIAANILSTSGDFWSIQDCAKVLDVFGNDSETLLEIYPTCVSLIQQNNLHATTLVHVNMRGTAVEVMAALNESFGMSGWVAFTLHAIGVEVYLRLTPLESHRLRQVSYERQLQAGHKHPGRSAIHKSEGMLELPIEVKERDKNPVVFVVNGTKVIPGSLVPIRLDHASVTELRGVGVGEEHGGFIRVAAPPERPSSRETSASPVAVFQVDPETSSFAHGVFNAIDVAVPFENRTTNLISGAAIE